MQVTKIIVIQLILSTIEYRPKYKKGSRGF